MAQGRDGTAGYTSDATHMGEGWTMRGNFLRTC
jgi:hypothetical protein